MCTIHTHESHTYISTTFIYIFLLYNAHILPLLEWHWTYEVILLDTCWLLLINYNLYVLFGFSFILIHIQILENVIRCCGRVCKTDTHTLTRNGGGCVNNRARLKKKKKEIKYDAIVPLAIEGCVPLSKLGWKLYPI